MLGGHEEAGLGWGGPGALWRHEHVELDERWGDDAHLSVQRVEAQVDEMQGRHGSQLLHGHVYQGERDRFGDLWAEKKDDGFTHCMWAQCLASPV